MDLQTKWKEEGAFEMKEGVSENDQEEGRDKERKITSRQTINCRSISL